MTNLSDPTFNYKYLELLQLKVVAAKNSQNFLRTFYDNFHNLGSRILKEIIGGIHNTTFAS
jgi:hypothetical protein